MASKSQHITESGDYIAIHSYYPRERKHEPFRAAAAAAAVHPPHRRCHPSISLLSGLFFPEALTTNDSGATPECGDQQCTPGAHGKYDSNEWLGSISSLNLKPHRLPQAVVTQRSVSQPNDSIPIPGRGF